MNFVDGLNNLALAAYEEAGKGGVVIKAKLLLVGREVSYIAHELYSVEGLEKLAKALIANLRLLSCIPAIAGVFKECLATLEGQKDLYYATMIFSSFRHFVGKNDQGERCFQFPRREDDNSKSGRDWHKFWGLFANLCELGKFLQKQNVFAFEKCSAFAAHYGACEVYGHRLDAIPIIGNMFTMPKDGFVFIMSGIELKRCYQEPGDFWIKSCKVVGNVGKMALITFGPYYSKSVAFRVLDVVTQNASLFGYLIKKCQDRQKRFDHPQAAAAA